MSGQELIDMGALECEWGEDSTGGVDLAVFPRVPYGMVLGHVSGAGDPQHCPKKD